MGRDDGETPEQARERLRASLRRQYEVAVRRNRFIPDSFSLAPRRRRAQQ